MLEFKPNLIRDSFILLLYYTGKKIHSKIQGNCVNIYHRCKGLCHWQKIKVGVSRPCKRSSAVLLVLDSNVQSGDSL